MLSTMATCSATEVAAVQPRPHLYFQLYLLRFVYQLICILNEEPIGFGILVMSSRTL